MAYGEVCVLIPTLNEQESIGPVIKEFKDLGFENILVVDGHSTDETVSEAEAAGARVIIQSGNGKGQALKEVFNLCESTSGTKWYIVEMGGPDGNGFDVPREALAKLRRLGK